MKLVTLKNKYGKVTNVKIGYSFTTLFFSFFPDLIRGNFKNAFLFFLFMLVANMLLVMAGSADITNLTAWLFPAIWAHKRNKYLLEHYMNKGYSVFALQNLTKEELDSFVGYEVEMKGE